MKRDHLIAVYDTHEDAVKAVKMLEELGNIDKKDISVLGRSSEYEPKDSLEIEKENADIVDWGKTGAALGGLYGFLAGAFFMWVPGFGPLIAAGPIISSLAGALGGAAVVGSISAVGSWLVDIGVEEAEAHRYANLIKEGKLIVLVHGSGDMIEKAKEILSKEGKADIKLHKKA